MLGCLIGLLFTNLTWSSLAVVLLVRVANDWVTIQTVVLQPLSVVSCHHGSLWALAVLLVLWDLLPAVADQDGVEERVLLSRAAWVIRTLGRTSLLQIVWLHVSDLYLRNRSTVWGLLEVLRWLLGACMRPRFLVERMLGARGFPSWVHRAPLVARPVLLVSPDRVTNVGVLLSTYLSSGISHHICHFSVSELLSLVEARLSVVVLATVVALKLVLNCPHNKLIGCGLVRYLLRAHASISLQRFLRFARTWILMRSPAVSRIRDLTTLEIEDIVLDCWKGAVIAHVETRGCLLFLFIAVEIYLNLRSLDWSHFNRPLLDILVRTPCIAWVSPSSDHLDTITPTSDSIMLLELLLGPWDHFNCLVKHGCRIYVSLIDSSCAATLWAIQLTRSIISTEVRWVYGISCISIATIDWWIFVALCASLVYNGIASKCTTFFVSWRAYCIISVLGLG